MINESHFTDARREKLLPPNIPRRWRDKFLVSTTVEFCSRSIPQFFTLSPFFPSTLFFTSPAPPPPLISLSFIDDVAKSTVLSNTNYKGRTVGQGCAVCTADEVNYKRKCETLFKSGSSLAGISNTVSFSFSNQSDFFPPTSSVSVGTYFFFSNFENSFQR